MLLINKPKGITSFKVVQTIKKLTGANKVGHAGTLDPLAEGLLIILVGKEETKLSQDFLQMDKEYESTLILGIKTATGDLEGEILNTQPVNISDDNIYDTFKKFTGTFKWEVPLYSAIKVGGKPLYKYARENAVVKIPKKDMTIRSIQVLKISRDEDLCYITYKCRVSSGTYIRTLNEQIGLSLNLPATTGHIKRTRIGKFRLEDAVSMEEVRSNHLKCT